MGRARAEAEAVSRRRSSSSSARSTPVRAVSERRLETPGPLARRTARRPRGGASRAWRAAASQASELDRRPRRAREAWRRAGGGASRANRGGSRDRPGAPGAGCARADATPLVSVSGGEHARARARGRRGARVALFRAWARGLERGCGGLVAVRAEARAGGGRGYLRRLRRARLRAVALGRRTRWRRRAAVLDAELARNESRALFSAVREARRKETLRVFSSQCFCRRRVARAACAPRPR